MGADMKTAEKKWIFSSFNKFDGRPIETISDVAETVAHSAMRGDKPELWGVSLDEKDEDGGVLVVCYTGNGPNSEANARLISVAPELLAALKDAKEIIKVMHGEVAWEIYDQCSPEMMRLNAAISKAENTL